MVEAEKIRRLVTDKGMVRLLLCTAFSLFLFSEPTRAMLNQSSFNVSFNLLYIFFGIVTIVLLILMNSVDIRVALVACAFLGVAVMTLVLLESNFLFKFAVIISTMFLPFMMTGIRLPEVVFEAFIEKFIKGANVVCLTLVAIGMVDYLSGSALQMFLAQRHIFESDQARLVILEHSVGIYRYYSVMGHPLINAWYLLAFYSLNILHNRYFRVLLNEYLLTLVTLIGLMLCSSRTALILGLFMGVFLNNRKQKGANLLLLSVVSGGLSMTSMFRDNLRRRFALGMNSKDASGGRNEALTRVFDGFVTPPNFFTGGGLGYSRHVTLLMGGFITSFEYPFMMFAYDFGILGTVLIYMLILVIPVAICMNHKHGFMIIFLVAISIFLNGFNGIATYTDSMGQFCFFVMIMVNMSYVIQQRQEGDVKVEEENNDV